VFVEYHSTVGVDVRYPVCDDVISAGFLGGDDASRNRSGFISCRCCGGDDGVSRLENVSR